MNQSNILIVLQIKPNFPIPATPSFRSIRDYVTKPPRSPKIHFCNFQWFCHEIFVWPDQVYPTILARG